MDLELVKDKGKHNMNPFRPHGDGLLLAGLFFTNYTPSWEKTPPPLLRTRGYVIPGGAGMAQLVARSTVSRCVVGSSPRGGLNISVSLQCSATG